MHWSWTPYALPLFAAATLCLLVAGVGLQRRAPGVTAFAVLLSCAALWSGADALELLSASLPQKLLWARVQYIGIVIAPVVWLIFSLQYTGRIGSPGWMTLASLLAIPFATLALLWHSQASALIWRSARLVEGPGFDLLSLGHGPWFWLHTGYSYALSLAAAAVLALALRQSPALLRNQGPTLSLAVGVPFLLNVLYVSGASTLDLTSYGFVATGVLAFWALARQRFLDVMPVARSRVVEGMRDGVIVLDGEDRVVDVNHAAAKIVGRRQRAIIGVSFAKLFAGRVELRQLTEEGTELRLRTGRAGDDAPRTYELRSWPLFEKGRDRCGWLIVLRDITRHKHPPEAEDHPSRLRDFIEQLPAVLWSTDEELRITEILGAGLAQASAADGVAGMPLSEVVDSDDENHPAIVAHRRALEGVSGSYSMEWFGREFDCRVQPLTDEDGAVRGVVGVGVDVTERQDLQGQLQRSQKMEAIGRMAGGVAHDFNNLLTAIVGYAQLAHEDLDSVDSDPAAADKLRRDLEAIGHAADRATAITEQLLAFSRRQVLHPRTLNLNDTLAEMDAMLTRLTGPHIEIVTSFDPSCEPVKIDPVQVQQVIINLVLNARDAMPSGGRITLETANVELEEGISVPYDFIPPGPYVLLTLADEGCGMDEGTMARIFEPFFTTKEAGKGTGLGLSTVYGIVRQTDGYVRVASGVGEGTTFRIYFPAVEAEEEVRVDADLDSGEVRLRGGETVLLVEDEDMVRELASRVMSSNGYFVLEAEAADEALAMCRRHEGPIDLLVTDVVLPGINGGELADRIVNILPDIAVLYISGYTGGALVEHGVLRDGINFLQKPFSPQLFLRKVRDVLDGRR
jgi:PAS domain S-box-containing protein